MSPKKADTAPVVVQEIPVQDIKLNPFLAVLDWGQSNGMMQDIGDAKRWANKMGALLGHSPQQCFAVANILTRGCEHRLQKKQTVADEAYRAVWPGYNAEVYWIYENLECVENLKLYGMLLQKSQELDVTQLPLKYEQVCSWAMLDEVRRKNMEEHDKKVEALEKQWLAANGGRMPASPELNMAEMLKGPPFEQRGQPESTRGKTAFARKLFSAAFASDADNIPKGSS